MPGHIEFISNLIYGTGAEAVVTPNHNNYLATTPSPSGNNWIARYLEGTTSLLAVYESWLRTNNLPPIYPYDGSNLSEWDPGDIANAGFGLALPANLRPTFISFANRDALGIALRNRLVEMQTGINSVRSADLQDPVKAPYSHRFWGYLKWASLILRRFDGELVDFRPPILYDRDGTILSAIPFLDIVNDGHWHWHDFDPALSHHALPLNRPSGPYSPAGALTPGYSSPVGQRASANSQTDATFGHDRSNEEFLRFHRDHIQMFHNWLARTGQSQQASINMLSVLGATSTGDFGWPPSGAGTPSTWTPASIPPWANSEAEETARRSLFSFATRRALAGTAMGSYHARGHNANRDIVHPFRNNYVPRFFAWHGFLDDQWFFREPRFARWNTATRVRERIFRPVIITTGAAWPGMPALTIVRDPSAPADAVSPANALSGLNLTTGAGTLRMEFVVRDTYDRLLRARFRLEVFNDAVSTTTAVETVTADRTVGPGGAVALGTNFTVDFALTTGLRSSDPTRSSTAVGFVNSRLRVTGTLAPNDGTDTGFTHEDYIDIDLVQERERPAVDIFLNLSSFSDNQVSSKSAEPDGTKRFRNAVMVTVQDRTSRPAPIPWPSTMIPELEPVLSRPTPAAGLLDNSSHAPQADLWQPTVDAPFTGLRTVLASGPVKEDPSLPDNMPQRYTYFYDVVFDATTDAFSGLATGASQRARLRFRTADRSGNTATSETRVTLFRDANPYMLDGDPAWLSQDTRVIRIFQDEALFGVTMVVDQPNNFIASLLTRLNDGTVPTATRDGWFSSLPTFSGQDALEFSTSIRTPATGAVRKIYNFALARVRVQGTVGASRVRTFFRLFTYSGSNLIFDESLGYRVHTDGTRKVPLLGFAASGEVISIPFFAVPRAASTADMRTQTEDTPNNVRSFPGGSTAEQIQYFGAYLDINQDAAALPARRLMDATRVDGPFEVAELQPIRTTIRDAHQCMVVELRYDGDATNTGDTPFSSDNLAQRNLVILRSDNPGSPITRTVEHSFEADTRCAECADEKLDHNDGHHHAIQDLTFITNRGELERIAKQEAAPTDFSSHILDNLSPSSAPGFSHDRNTRLSKSFPLVFDPVDWFSAGDIVDELLFLWNNLPVESRVELFLPGVRAETVVNLRNVRHSLSDIRIIDEHRLLLIPTGVTFVPLPPTPEQRVAGVITITLPDGVKHGQSWKVDVIQVRSHDRGSTGGFQLDIRVEKDIVDMAEAEQRLLSILFERRSLLSRDDRWRPILDQRVGTTRLRARALADRAGIVWNDPTVWVDPKGDSHDVAGPRLRVVVDKIEILKDYDPWLKGRGEIAFVARVETVDNGGKRVDTRMPERGYYKISDVPGHNLLSLNQTIFVGHAFEDLRIEIVGTEYDLFDPNDWMGKCVRVLCGRAENWFGEYGPRGDQIVPENAGPWRIWYRIERGGS